MVNREPKLSVGLALEQSKEAVEVVRKLNDQLDFARKERNRVIKEALRFVTISQMMRTTGMSRESLYKIKHSPDD